MTKKCGAPTMSKIPVITIGAAMTSGGAVMTPRGGKIDPGMDKLGVQGHGLVSARSRDGSTIGAPSGDTSPSESRPSSSSGGETFGSFKMPPEAVNVLETVINMNKALEQQIDALRLRLNVEAKHHDAEKEKLVSEKDKAIEDKEIEVDELKDSLVTREEQIKGLVKEEGMKHHQLIEKVKEVENLKDLVKQTEDYAEQLHKRVEKLKGDKHRLESDTAFKEQKDDIRKLKHELVSLKDKLVSMEKELLRAKHIMDQQSNKIKSLDFEKSAINDKFKTELDKASKAMRSEVERMREVMKQQYEEMRNLREQNNEISVDVKDIKDILIKGTVTLEPEIRSKQRLDVNNFKTARPAAASTTSGYRGAMTSRPNSKTSAAVRASVPNMKELRSVPTLPGGRSKNLPPISKVDETGRWIPTGRRNPTFSDKRK